ncbi:MAG: hypothetical protein ABIN97_14580, partial [Ginsengibacter sp.]
MSNKSKKATLGRRVFVSVALIALLGIFLALYYFIYIPQQEAFYNKRAFRVLDGIATNFKEGLLAHKEGSRPLLKYDTLKFNDFIYDSLNIKNKLSNLEGIPANTATASPQNKAAADSSKIDTSAIIEPLISIHGSTFESVLLINLKTEREKEPHSGRLIYKSPGLNIDEEINADSLFKRQSAFSFPVMNNINIEGTDYKLFLFPFRIQGQKLLLGGFVSNHTYKANTHSFPVTLLVVLGILLISLLISLPFLKIYLIGPQENISVKDIRSVVAMIYVIPVFLVLLGSAIWLHYTNTYSSNKNLQGFHNHVKANFYDEIGQAIKQLKHYDSIYQNTRIGFNYMSAHFDAGNKIPFVDAYMHPSVYKNFDGLFWINAKGQEIAKWNFVNTLPSFFEKGDRQYYKDLKNNSGYYLPGDTTHTQFSIQSTLAKSKGDYTISVAIKSNSAFNTGQALLIGLHGKMYSMFNPVVPLGYNFCIINSDGDILYHSESKRALQENLFVELNDSMAIKTAVSRKQTLLINNMELYENNVKLLIKPIEGLPYFLVTYSNKKVDLLYITHIISFSFFCESMLLIIIALLTLFYYYSNNKFSKLFFAENDFNFAKPSPHKTEYYKKILYYQAAILMVAGIFFIVFNGKVLLSYVLYSSFLLPAFSVIGYYLIRAVENYHSQVAPVITSAQSEPINKTQQILALFKNGQFVNSFIKLMLPYIILIWIFFIIKNNISHASFSATTVIINSMVALFAIVFPSLAIYFSLFGLPRWLVFKKRILQSKHKYLSYFVLAIMISATLTSVMPTLGFILFAAGQEKSLQLKTRQTHLGHELANRRNYINQKVSETKLNIIGGGKRINNYDSVFIDSIKFSAAKGVYTGNNNIATGDTWNYNKQNTFNNSQFYKQVTQYLFLPTEHSDYFANAGDFYYWRAKPMQQAKKDSLVYHYKNSSDHINTSNVIITSSLPSQPSFLSVLKYRLGIILLLSVMLLLIVFYKIIYSASMRIFLIDYFDKTPGTEQDVSYLDKEVFEKEDLSNKEFEKEFWGLDKVTLNLITAKENAYATITQREECILKIQTLLAPQYEIVWEKLSPTEQFVLYDFAIDGFSNYKNVDILYSLYKKGIIKKEENSFVIMTDSFRNYLISKKGSEEINKLRREISEGGTWGNLRTVLLIIIFLIVVFLFIVQEDMSKRVFAIVTSVGAAIPIILKLFDRNLSGSGNA